MSSFHNHSFDLAKALRLGDLSAANDALEMMVRDGDRAKARRVQEGRAAADREAGKVRPLPALSDA